MRQSFTAKPGWVMVGCDSKGNQMRQLAARMQDEEFTYAVLHGTKEEGTDLHSLNMKRTGIPFRNRVKNFFYGSVLFGAGDKKNASILGCSVEEGRNIRAGYFEEMPGLKRVKEELGSEWKQTAHQSYNRKFNKIEFRGGMFRGLDGRPIKVEFEKDLLAYALQSDEAIHMGLAYCLLNEWADERWEYGEDWGSLIWMHDEFQMECKPEIADELGELAAEAIRVAGEILGIDCPHGGDYGIGDNWYETH
jgi:DNA polymerase-1